MSSGGNKNTQSYPLHPSQYGAEGLPGPNFEGSIFGTSSHVSFKMWSFFFWFESC